MIARTTAATLAVAIGALVSLSACNTMKSARDRVVRAPARCADQTVQVYFEQDSAEIGKESQAVISAAAQASKTCAVTGVDVTGLADATGAPDANLDLSRRRAEAVTAALAKAGVPAETVKIAAAGQNGAVNAAGQARPLRRRADVVLHMTAR